MLEDSLITGLQPGLNKYKSSIAKYFGWNKE
jgi:hypothetical protein